MSCDLLIRGGTVLDGTGGAPQRADVAVVDGRIAEVGRIDGDADRTLEADGCVVAPGFIDIHSHSDYTLLIDPRAASAIHQGVTTEVIGNCGFGCAPIARPELAGANIYGFDGSVPLAWRDLDGYLTRLAAAQPAVNVLTLVPNGQLRRSVVGVEQRAAQPDELKAMTRLLEEGLEQGAWGFSTGLEYPAETGAGEAELTALCGTVARHGCFYATHTRARDQGAIEAIEEGLRTARNANVRLQVSHLIPRQASDAARSIEVVEQARDDGLDVAFDMHTRLFGTTMLSTLLPPWAAGKDQGELAALLDSADARARMKGFRSIIAGSGNWERVVLLDLAGAPDISRRSLAEIGRMRGREPFDAALDILRDNLHQLHKPMVIINCYTEAEQAMTFAHPLCMPGSDATTLAPDGPLAGSVFHGAYSWASWFYRFMVRDRRLLKPEAAIRKLTSQPADVLGLADRGTLTQGARADIAVFDPETFGERGTVFAPNALATGIRHVIVNGAPTLEDGALTGQRAGAVLRRTGRVH
jgi:N-acyl-D-aspartate/D-glutamate deacylase